MALVIHPFVRPVLGVDDLAPWSSIPTAIISDERNRPATDACIRAVTAG